MSTDDVEFLAKVEWLSEELFEHLINNPEQVFVASADDLDFAKVIGGVVAKIESMNLRLHWEIHRDSIYFRMEIPEN